MHHCIAFQKIKKIYIGIFLILAVDVNSCLFFMYMKISDAQRNLNENNFLPKQDSFIKLLLNEDQLIFL